ncbi:putative ATP-dependent 6-phosphofructokinase [Mycoplasmoides pneumoniae]|uniref:ATP-dependent 6-phosphofructokinase n=1 Tax=Mycoplasmoides pneumoniae TaxID=2104 RepID=UPI001330BE5D|nr:ATP-dependent 6-phosphofructokinase [Mycoplasmoides pneumoniae]GLL59760.1 putative ATP-dependent 6-phosphofructokinase [Mycoplasmoides pneumoniae]
MSPKTTKKIAILTSGGDAPGMNATLVYLTRYATSSEIEVFFVTNGYYGLYHDELVPAHQLDLSNSLFSAGTVIGSKRFVEFKELKVREQAAQNLKKRQIDYLVVIGGDGSYMGAKLLSELGVNCYCLPGTIDNDINSSEFTIGFLTALESIKVNVQAVYHTTKSHERVAIVEVMGRHCGDLAIFGALATNADFVVTPSNKMDLKQLESAVKKILQHQNHCVVIVSENIYGFDGYPSLTAIKQHFDANNMKCNLVSLGHTQRGFAPTSLELVQISLMAQHTINLIGQNKVNQVIGNKANVPVNYDFDQAFNMPPVDRSALIAVINKNII